MASGTSSGGHVSISVWPERGEEGTAGGKKLLEGWLNVPNVNYASGVPSVPQGPR